MRIYETYLFDIDGTLIKGNQALPGAKAYIHKLREAQKQILFVTNNPVLTPVLIAQKLQKLGIRASPEEIITPIDAVHLFLTYEAAPIHVLALVHPLVQAELTLRGWDINNGGDEEKMFSHVLLGMNDYLTYRDLVKGLQAVDGGASLVVLNPDLYCPLQQGRAPDSGALSYVLEQSSGKGAQVVGKPTVWMQRVIQARLQSTYRDSLFVGDSPYTDMEMGRQMGMDTLFLQSGISQYLQDRTDLQQSTYSFATLEEALLAMS